MNPTDTLTMEAVLLGGLVVFLLSYYVVLARIGRPFRTLVTDKVAVALAKTNVEVMTTKGNNAEPSRGLRARQGVLDWLSSGLTCRVCVGQWVAIVLHATDTTPAVWTWGLDSWVLVAAMNSVALLAYMVTEALKNLKELGRIT